MLSGKAAIAIAIILAIVIVVILIAYCYYPSSNDCDDKESHCEPRNKKQPTSPPSSAVDWEKWKSVKRSKVNESHSDSIV